MSFRRALPVLLVLLALVLAGALSLLRVVTVRADIADFLPAGRTAATELLMDQLRSGAAASVVLIGIEGAPPEDLARISKALAGTLRGSPTFRTVGNDASGFAEGERDFLLAHRYLLSPAVTAGAFGEPALRDRLNALLQQLYGATAPLAKRFGFSDPVGAWMALAGTWIGTSEVDLRHGVWFARDMDRALLVADAAVSALDPETGRAMLDEIGRAFAAASPREARLLTTGPAVFAVASAEAIRRDVHRVSVLSAILVAGFLIWRHRSAYVLAAAAIPLLAGLMAGVLVTQLAFGFVHAIALGFGATMLGVAADYPLLLIGQRGEAESTRRAARRIWPTMALAAASAVAGLTAMLASSFPGLSQLGLLSAVGLATAALVTRFVLPRLVEDVAFRGQQVTPGWIRAAGALAGLRPWLLAGMAAAAGWLLLAGGPSWQRDLEGLDTASPEARRLDAELRRQLGAPDVRHLIVLSGADIEAVLQASERLATVTGRLVAEGAIGSATLPSDFLPSRRTQAARQAMLPEPAELEARLRRAAAGTPFMPEAFGPFVAAVAGQRTMPPVTFADLERLPVLAARLAPLLGRRGDGWHGLALLGEVRDAAAVSAAVAALGDPSLGHVDLKRETEAMVLSYADEAMLWAGAGAAVLVLVMLACLRHPLMVLRVAAPIVGAGLVTLLVLDLLSVRLTLFHLAALLLMTGVGIDYSLFLARQGIDDADGHARTLGSVLNCSATTLLTFGLLSFCRNPVMSSIGITVAVGVLASVVLAIGLSRPRGAA
ncbi:MAG TPA: MMPL family transporter [Geminicoccaceae bacterium]|nr:MMPL family transporter [Geminicoccus sp.]HMU51239.1 MMPL family transporter [Geminicoccaceae bacterium]